MVDSSVDVCDLMINLLCLPCSDRECADDDPVDHSKLMDCIREKWINREAIKERLEKGPYPYMNTWSSYQEAMEKFVDDIRELAGLPREAEE